MLAEQKLELEVQKLSLEIERMRVEKDSWYSRYGDVLRLFLGFLLTGLLGSYIGLTLQQRSEREKTRAAAHERYVQKCEDTLKMAESVLARRQYYQLQMIGVLKKRATGDMNTDREKEEDVHRGYSKAVEDWNISLNMNRTIIRKVFGDAIGLMFYDGGEGIQWPDMSLTLKFVTMHGGITKQWRDYQAEKTLSIASLDELSKRHVELAENIATFYDQCLQQIMENKGGD